MKRLLAFALLLILGAAPPPAALPLQQVSVIASYPHDPDAFTQGLFFEDGILFESTGLEGQSVIRQVRLRDGKVLKESPLPGRHFGEGIVAWKGRLISLTWRDGIGFLWDRNSLKQTGSFRYSGEGWALTHNGREIVMSDGTPELRILDPRTLKEQRRITVTANGRPLRRINELEWVKGEIFANIWLTDLIARIDPATGRVTAWIDLSRLAGQSGRRGTENVANGIAYDAAGDRLFVTGKNWPGLHQVKIIAP